MMRLNLSPGSMAPWYYGLAYRDFEADRTILYPVPFHLIVRWARRFWWWFRFSGVQNRRDIELRSAFNKGRVKGYEEGREQGRKDLEDELSELAWLLMTPEEIKAWCDKLRDDAEGEPKSHVLELGKINALLEIALQLAKMNQREREEQHSYNTALAGPTGPTGCCGGPTGVDGVPPPVEICPICHGEKAFPRVIRIIDTGKYEPCEQSFHAR